MFSGVCGDKFWFGNVPIHDRHPGESRDPVLDESTIAAPSEPSLEMDGLAPLFWLAAEPWIPAYAGMTAVGGAQIYQSVIPGLDPGTQLTMHRRRTWLGGRVFARP